MKKNIQWQNVMAPIKPFYPVRCNSTPGVLEILGTLGVGFACFSKVSFHFLYLCALFSSMCLLVLNRLFSVKCHSYK